MTPDLQQALQAALSSATTEFPLVVRDLLLWQMTQCAIWMGMLGGGCVVALWLRRKAPAADRVVVLWIAILLGLWALLPASFLLQAILFPRAYLLEYARTFLR